ncbi:MAG: hypothetical protein LBU83_02410 [Bacteroidales bacterium]|jgi:hypothetical protein|nr:hypothetical protein [Bacteroidales bacterium]
MSKGTDEYLKGMYDAFKWSEFHDGLRNLLKEGQYDAYRVIDDEVLYVAMVEKNNKYGIIKYYSRGCFHTILPAIYDEIIVDWTKFAAKLNNKWGLFDSNGEQLKPFEYDTDQEALEAQLNKKIN